MSCVICEVRKEKRFCPAVHGRICPQCCGEQREVTLECPLDCPYLIQAREHEKPRSADQIDPAALFLQIEVSDQFMYQHEHLLMGLLHHPKFESSRLLAAHGVTIGRAIGAMDAIASQPGWRVEE